VKISELGEFGLIQRLQQWLGEWGVAQRPGLAIGSGDDAAVWQASEGLQVITTDALVEGVHFTLERSTWPELGWKALAINLSDLAAMGAEPDLALVSLGLPPATEVAAVEALYQGMAELARHHGVAIAGGNLTRSPVVHIHLTATGHLPAGEVPLTRERARPGEAIAVTGSLGGAAGWLRLAPVEPEAAACLRLAHFRPQPRLAEGRLLARVGVAAAIDISDGLVSDLAKLCRASGVAARLEADRLPVHPQLAAALPEAARELALYGGEDYELLFTAPRERIAQVAAQAAIPITIIGEVVAGPPGQVALVEASGAEAPASPQGWDHFSPR